MQIGECPLPRLLGICAPNRHHYYRCLLDSMVTGGPALPAVAASFEADWSHNCVDPSDHGSVADVAYAEHELVESLAAEGGALVDDTFLLDVVGKSLPAAVVELTVGYVAVAVGGGFADECDPVAAAISFVGDIVLLFQRWWHCWWCC